MSDIVPKLIAHIIACKNYYDVLGVTSRDCNNALKLRQNYIKRSRLIHPDKNPVVPEATTAFQKLSVAYNTLKDPVTRAEYDAGGVTASNVDVVLIQRIISDLLINNADSLYEVVDQLGDHSKYHDYNEYLDLIRVVIPKVVRAVSDVRLLYSSLHADMLVTASTLTELYELPFSDVYSRMRLLAVLLRTFLSMPLHVQLLPNIFSIALNKIIVGIDAFIHSTKREKTDV